MRQFLLLVLISLFLFPSLLAQEKNKEEKEKKNKNKKTQLTNSLSLPLTFRDYYTFKEMEEALGLLAKKYPSLIELKSFGKSLQGRDLWMVTLTAPRKAKVSDKPAMYIDGNIHGNEIQGTEVCLYTIQHLAEGYGKNKYLTGLLERFVFYIAPCVNPDGRVAFLKNPQNPHTSRWNRRPVDNDRDGRTDEDGPNDLDGDGQILMMRVKDPQGRWKVSEKNPQVMKRCRPGEKGEYRVYWTEGIDDDGDGRINEDGPGGVDLNRNFPANWAPPHRQYGAGEYPLSEPETRAIADFILARPHIAAVQSYHNFGRLIIRPPASRTDKGLSRRDIAIYDVMGKKGTQILPGYKYIRCYDGLYRLKGGFFDWTYLKLGIFTFTNELWNMPQDFDKNGKVTAAERVRWSKLMGGNRGFIQWKPFRHPTLGKIELGGWSKMSRRIPPMWMMEEMCYRNCRFTLYHAESMPQVKVTQVQVKKLPQGLYRLRVRIVNQGLMPTASDQARRMKRFVPDVAKIKIDKGRILAGGRERGEGKVARLVEKEPDRIELGNLASQGSLWVQWIVSGQGKIKIEVASQKGGRSTKEVKLP